MKHVYLIKYDRYEKQSDGSRKKVGEDWTTVLGIGATRLIMSRQGSFSYVDDTPRIMSEEEQKKIFGRVDAANIVAITKLRTKSGLEASGYGKYPRDKNPMGTDKGNSVENMAFIRSERSAFGRLFPDAKLPATVDVVDEQYMDTPSGKVEIGTGEIMEETVGEDAGSINQEEESTDSPPELENNDNAKGETSADLIGLDFKNPGEFYTACLNHFKLSKSQVEKEVPEFDLTNANQRRRAWQQIVAVYGQTKSQ
jgi:hypothetical protein